MSEANNFTSQSEEEPKKQKRFYWLKLMDNFFDDDTIQYIEEQENGVAYSNFYLKLCLKSLKTEGSLIRLVGEKLVPYDDKSLSKLTGVDCNIVSSAMKLFTQIGLVKKYDNGELYLSLINEMIGSETDKAAIMRKKRALEKNCNNVTDNSNNVTKVLPQSYLEIEKEIEIDKDIDTSGKLTPAKSGRKGEHINYEEFVSSFNSICQALPKVQRITDKRKKAIKKAVKVLEDMQTTKEKLFAIVEASDFLSGRNGKWSSCCFDWIIKPANLTKIIEGTYNNKGSTKNKDQTSCRGTASLDYSVDDFFK